MTPYEMLFFVTWHIEIGSALDTRVKQLGGGLVKWSGRLVGPRFNVYAEIVVKLEGHYAVGTAFVEAEPGSHIFDMVLGCRLLCPPGQLIREGLPNYMHTGTSSYLNLEKGACLVSWGAANTCFGASCSIQNTPDDFAWVPYIADEPDGWRLHARVRASRGGGFRRTWLFDREVLRKPILNAEQHVSTEIKAYSPFYRFFRTADYREYTVSKPLAFKAEIRIALPVGIIP